MARTGAQLHRPTEWPSNYYKTLARVHTKTAPSLRVFWLRRSLRKSTHLGNLDRLTQKHGSLGDAMSNAIALGHKFKYHQATNGTFVCFLTHHMADQSAIGLKLTCNALQSKVKALEAESSKKVTLNIFNKLD
jgi:hypothetical protein